MGQLNQTTAELQTIIEGVFAEIYTDDSVITQSIPTGATYTKLTNFLSNGESKSCTADQANNKITITQAGEYKIEFNTSFTSSGSNVNWFGAVFVDGSELDDIHFERKIGSGGDYGSTAIGGIYNVTTAPVDVDVRFRHDSGGALDLTKRYMNLNVVRIGEL